MLTKQNKITNQLKIENMVEVIKHTLGFCGEHWHPNLWTLLVGGLGSMASIKYGASYMRCKLNQMLNWKNGKL